MFMYKILTSAWKQGAEGQPCGFQVFCDLLLSVND